MLVGCDDQTKRALYTSLCETLDVTEIGTKTTMAVIKAKEVW